MGTTCSMIRADLEDGDVMIAAQKSDSVTASYSVNTDEEIVSLVHGLGDSFPRDLLNLLRQSGANCDLPEETAEFVQQAVSRCISPLVSDSEALAILTVLSRVMDRHTSVLAATILKERGYPSEAMSCLRFLPHSVLEAPEVETLIRELQTIRLERWSRMDAEIVEYSGFWDTYDLSDATDLCEDSLDKILKEMNKIFYQESTSKFGVKGMLDDTPSDESTDLGWSKESNLNFAEQQKSIAMWIRHSKNLKRQHKRRMQRIENIYRFKETKSESPLLHEARLFSKNACTIYGVRFVKVEALLAMDELVQFEALPPDAFTEEGHFAVSYRWGGTDNIDPCGYTLDRLKEVLTSVNDIKPTDGVFIDWCCAPRGDPLASIFAKAIFEQCHVIFLPSADFFTRSWCTFECMSWLLSPFPNQALGDYNFLRCITLMCAYHFGRPAFVLDRPELQVLGRVCMGTTDATNPADKEFLTWSLGENRIKSTGLRESLTKLIFKFESTVIV